MRKFGRVAAVAAGIIAMTGLSASPAAATLMQMRISGVDPGDGLGLGYFWSLTVQYRPELAEMFGTPPGPYEIVATGPAFVGGSAENYNPYLDPTHTFDLAGGYLDLDGFSGQIYVGNSTFGAIFDGCQLPPTPTTPLKVSCHGGGSFDRAGFVYTDDIEFTVLPEPPTPGVPEPSAWALMILGFGGVGAGLRRRRTSASALLPPARN